MAKSNIVQGKTDWKRLKKLRDQDIRRAAKSDPDAAPIASAEWFHRANLLSPRRKAPISLRLDADVLKWFQAHGRGYQTRINAVLRAYFESQTLK
jgi:uncharacterized protein (DUF4415 family)